VDQNHGNDCDGRISNNHGIHTVLYEPRSRIHNSRNSITPQLRFKSAPTYICKGTAPSAGAIKWPSTEKPRKQLWDRGRGESTHLAKTKKNLSLRNDQRKWISGCFLEFLVRHDIRLKNRQKRKGDASEERISPTFSARKYILINAPCLHRQSCYWMVGAPDLSHRTCQRSWMGRAFARKRTLETTQPPVF
jgi:hypothetical protein